MRASMHAPAVIALVFALSWALTGTAASAEPLPYDLDIRVEFGKELGSERVREQIEKTVVNELQRAECFRSVRRYVSDGEPSPDLVLVLLIDEVIERIEHDQSMAAEFEAIREDPRAALKVTGILDASVYFTLVEHESSLELKTVLENLRVQRRPQFLGEDYQQALRDDAVIVLAERARRLTCKGSVKKVEKLIEKAQAREAGAR